MAPTAITYYLLNSVALGSGFQQLQENGTAPTAAQSSTGWIVGTTATGNYSPMKQATKQLASTFGATIQPDGTMSNTNKNGFRIQTALTGIFDAGNWVFTFKLRSTTAAATGTMRVRCRVFKDTSATAATATELTSSVLIGSTVGPLSTSADVSSTVTWAAPQILLNNEYLFFEVALEIVTASGGSTQDALFRINPTTIVTSVFNGIILRSMATTAAVIASTILVTKATGTVLGDVMVVCIDADTSCGAVTSPNWTANRSDAGASASTSWIFTKVANGAEPSNYTFTAAVAGGMSAVHASYINVDNMNPVDDNTSGTTAASGTTATLPTFSSVGYGDKVIVCISSFSAGAIAASTTGTRLNGSVIVTTDVGEGDFQMGNPGASGALAFTVPSGAWTISGIMLRRDVGFPITPDVPFQNSVYRM